MSARAAATGEPQRRPAARPGAARVLVVEDNRDLAYGLRNSLEIAGYDVDVASDGAAGLAAARERDPQVIVLDLMLPEIDGYQVLRTLRAEGRTMPVLILTARGEETDKVLGFRLGADDYVTKPFGVLELLARVEALLRRATGTAPSAPLRFGDVEVDREARIVRRAGKPVELTPKEFDLLLALIDRRGNVMTRSDLLQAVWGYDETVVSRTVDTHVGELRRKLERDPASPEFIVTVWKVGYRLEVRT